MLIAIILLCFGLVSLYRYDWAMILFFALLPTYTIRLAIGPLPTTLLELLLVILIGTGLWHERKRIKKLPHVPTILMIGIGLFLLGATIGIIASVDMRAALGEWKAFYVEPIVLFIFLCWQHKYNANIQKYIYIGLLLSAMSTSLLAIYQGFTGWMVPPNYWPRVTGWYGFPNGIGLFLGMIFFPLILFGSKIKIFFIKKKTQQIYSILTAITLFGSLIAIQLSESTGALLGIIGGIGILLLTHKKTRIPALTLGIMGFFSIILFQPLTPLKQELLFQNRSGQIRIAMWQEALEMLTDRPIVGSGLASYHKRIVPYHTTVNGEGIEIFHAPHNIFLTIWTNIGIIGLLGYLTLLVGATIYTIKKRQYFLLAALTSITIMGLVDSPYIRNDLAILFWTVIYLIYTKKVKQLAVSY